MKREGEMEMERARGTPVFRVPGELSWEWESESVGPRGGGRGEG